MDKNKLKEAVEKMEESKRIIAAERDKLIDLCSEIESLIDSTDKGLDALEESIDALSEMV